MFRKEGKLLIYESNNILIVYTSLKNSSGVTSNPCNNFKKVLKYISPPASYRVMALLDILISYEKLSSVVLAWRLFFSTFPILFNIFSVSAADNSWAIGLFAGGLRFRMYAIKIGFPYYKTLVKGR